ncbi:TPA: hypothetical protein NIJ47_003727 [Klebsiella pneumoniae]|uniref:hypothetical protein n=1 Tax=Klebsiella TaxID=570 RepID=UPI0009CBD847|nr:hypothetical protein [Klebsiella pneumoniae]TYW70211.1 hypothetical protein FCG53_010280 [Klebsiella pneumoniae]SLN95630.1 Uncharacterised protein [Klebsiella pneumoniae]HBS6723814.1 hypothetical protein [Klebsiella pneumoniae]HCK0403252.1 hypothetical protein [Klebsiella pneumoniae]HDH0278637.1 hypothetical protein [Klebsiella pneumoniae]
MSNNKLGEVKSLLVPLSKIITNLIPYMTIVSGVIIWAYLKNIGRMDLFVDALSLNAGLVSLLFSTLFLSVFISIALVLPSYILILFKINNNTNDSRLSSATPVISLLLSIAFLCLVFLPYTGFVERWINGYKFSIENIIFIIFIAIALICCISTIINYDYSNKNSKIKVFFKEVAYTALNIFILFISILSISIPVSLLLRASKGEDTTSILFALLFMIIFSFFTFLPAMVFYRNIEKQRINKIDESVSKNIKNCAFTVMFSIFSITFIFPSISTVFVYSSLSSIGLIDKKTHYFKISGENYKPAMFPTSIWKTQTPSDMGNDFYIKGTNLFSLGSTNLICPLYIVNLRDSAYQNDFSTFIPTNDEKKINYLKKMTKTCVVLDDPDVRLWDTLFDAAGQIKK